MPPADPSFANTAEEAEARWKRYSTEDPFPDIPSALLNSADLVDYVAAIGMIHPFHYKDHLLKPASYEVALAGKCIYYDADGVRRSQDVAIGDEFVLPANSIAFVTLEPYFRLPNYLAMRFNLRITHVYRGLLLGTGPMVDPGFKGPLSLPLHNLTSNDYRLKGGEGLIWVEFTKLSPPPEPVAATASPEPVATTTSPERHGKMFYLEPDKAKGLTVVDYLSKADPHRSIQSSIPLEIEKASKAAESSARTVRQFGVYGAIALFITLAGIVFSVYQLVSQADSASNAARDQVVQSQTTIASLQQRVCNLERATRQPTSSECQTTIAPSPVATPAAATHSP